MKEPPRLQAQAEIFADKGVKEFSEDQARILEYSAELSKIKNLNNLPQGLPEELVRLIQNHRDTYVNFLRQERKLETSFIEENIKKYKAQFQPVIAALKVKMARGNVKELPEYLGSGSNGSAFRIGVNGERYAAKFSRNIAQANFELKPLLRAKGIPHTAQLVSYSFEDGVVVMELLPGINIADCTPEKKTQYTDDHIIQLIETVRQMDSRGLIPDPKPSNFMYDPKEGFFVLDYHLKNTNERYGLPQAIVSLRTALCSRKWPRLDYGAQDYKEKSPPLNFEMHHLR